MTESGFGGTFTATSANTVIASVAPGTATGPTAAFIVTAVAAGQTQVAISDGSGQTALVTVYVTTTSGAISTVHRHPR